ncbi:IMV p35 heparan binding surface protein [Sea otter poxvirus]|uniref:IMV p35 heparan binding surface protein n=1 Tax=Sea otter poxvirus TaxID=1416741 RepID=A0A2U9QHR4_9POXV|nr:IMV p35 heparan binding surface protein [Sea otter poxvirus]AWU47117.1 IMV p35 heparan binding surface protein [Sea otter poxvirus]
MVQTIIRDNLADDPKQEAYYAYVITLVGRKTTDVFPTLKHIKSNNGTDTDEIIKEHINNGHNFSHHTSQEQKITSRHHTFKSADNTLKITEWHVKDSDIEHNSDYPNFISPTCKSLCANETKERLIQHISLWNSYIKTVDKINQRNVSNNDPAIDLNNRFVIITEDDNTFNNPELLKPLILSMNTNNIDIIQLGDSSSPIGQSLSSLTPLVQNPPIYGYLGGLDFNLSSYIIRVSTMINLYKKIISTGGASAGLSLEISRLEKELGVTRYILSDSTVIVTHEPYYRVRARLMNTTGCFWKKMGLWLSKWYPKIVYFSTTPVFSIMGLFDIDIIDIFIIMYIFLLMIFYINIPILWFIGGMLITAIV